MSKKKHEFLKNSPIKFKPVSIFLDTKECFVSGNTSFTSQITVRGKGLDKVQHFSIPYRGGYTYQHEWETCILLFPNSRRGLWDTCQELGIHLYITKNKGKQKDVRFHGKQKPFYKGEK